MSRRTRGSQAKPNIAPTNADSENMTTMPMNKKRPTGTCPQAEPIDLEENSSHHQGSSVSRSCKNGDNASLLESQKLSWLEILSTIDHMVQKQIQLDVE